jgi:exodeoxyribonuclease-3
MKIATYNVNSIRKRLPLVLEWLIQNRPDVLCLQETKVQDEEFPVAALSEAGYHAYYRGMRGYNGVATLTRDPPERVIHGLHEGPDNEDFRIVQTVMRTAAGPMPIINCYVPQGYSIKSEKYAFKLAWFKRVRQYFEQHLDPAKPAVWLGDLNVAPEPLDVYHPDRRVNDVDFHIDARNAYKATAEWGFVDVFRKLHPQRVQYTYWDYFRNALGNNWGWRIDHILATEPLARLCQQADVDMAPRTAPGASDHTVVWAEFGLPAT